MGRARTSRTSWWGQSPLNWKRAARPVRLVVPKPRVGGSDEGRVNLDALGDAASAFLSRTDLADAGGNPEAAERARRIISEARGAGSKQRAIELAKRALKAYGDCADAYVLLAELDTVFSR